MSGEAPGRPRGRRAWGRAVAQLLCAIFAILGVLPMALGLLVHSEPIRRWAASQTANILEQQLHLRASYRVELRLWPLQLSLDGLTVPASDGGAPALYARRVSVKPRIFSLLGGRFDAGAISIEGSRVRLVLRDGKLANVSLRLPKSKGPAPKVTQAPFSSIALQGAQVDLDIDGVRVQTGRLDLQVSAEKDLGFDFAVHAGPSTLTRQRVVKPKPDAEPVTPEFTAYDEDRLCRLEARAEYRAGELVIHKLDSSAVADLDTAENTRPGCPRGDEPIPGKIELGASEFRIAFANRKVPAFAGRLSALGPLALVNRFVRMTPLEGYAGFAGDLSFDGSGKLPNLRGHVHGANIGLGKFKLAKRLAIDLEIKKEIVGIRHFEMGFGDGTVSLTNGTVRPFEPGAPLVAERVDGDSVSFSAMMRDLGVTPNTIVSWDLRKTHVSKIAGKLNPLGIEGEFAAETRDFEVFDRAYHDKARKHVIGVRAANVRGRVGVRKGALEFYDTRADFGKSHMLVDLVSVGFSNDLALRIRKGSKLELSDITPLLNIPMKGTADISVEMAGKAFDPLLTGDLAVQDLEFGGFPIGSITSGKLKFRPLFVEFSDVHGHKGRSEFVVSSARLDFDAGSQVVADAVVKSDKLVLRDFFAMWLFDADPRFKELDGEGDVSARIHYDLGGREDACRSGTLRVAGNLDMRKLTLFDENYDSAQAEFDFRWSDMTASYLGFDLDVPSLSLQKGRGNLLGSLTVSQGAKVRGHFVGNGVPIAKIDALGTLALGVDGTVSASAEVSGTLDELAVDTHVRLSPLRIGGGALPASEFTVRLAPLSRPQKFLGQTRCHHPIPAKFDKAEYDSDRSSGVFQITGALFDHQIRLAGISVTRQRNKRVSGNIEFDRLDVGALAELSPALALASTRPVGKLSGTLHIAEYQSLDPARAKAELALTELAIERAGVGASLLPGARPIVLSGQRLDVPSLSLSVRSPRGASGVVDLNGKIDHLGRAAQVSATLALRPVDLTAFAPLIPRADRVHGQFSGSVHLTGSPSALSYSGGFALHGGEIRLRGFPSPISEVELGLALSNDELRITRGSARVGNGSITLSGGAPLRGFELGALRTVIRARELSLPAFNGLRAALDADLVATWQPPSDQSERSLPRITGDVTLRSFEYSRPISMTADISALAQRGKRTEFEAYDPADDVVEFDVSVRANRTLRIANNLMEMELETEPQGLLLAGTNQRFGTRGALRIKPGGRIRLRQSEFEIRQGNVRFDDLTRIAPQVDVTATTEYRRYSQSLSATDPNRARSSDSPTTTGLAASAGGRWRISLHAHGDADKLKIDLTSEPALAQDDIFLLLTVGVTRAELDQAQSASVGESVALEALGTLTGADRAVKEAVPVIDEFRFGSAYSSRTGRTEPTVTIGKRLAERIRANVTSGLSESREIRSNLEWRLSPRLSVEGSYDNVNDISSSSLGNLGGDVRWRLEFQ